MLLFPHSRFAHDFLSRRQSLSCKMHICRDMNPELDINNISVCTLYVLMYCHRILWLTFRFHTLILDTPEDKNQEKGNTFQLHSTQAEHYKHYNP